MANTFKYILNHNITLTIVFCVSYFLLAILGFEWGALTQNATLLWPPSGFAVFGFLVFGRRALVGLLLGATLASQIISLAHPLGNTVFSLTIASINGIASILQALVIAYVSRGYYEKKFRVATRASVNFILLVLVSCCVATTIGNLMLWLTDVIDFSSALQNWAVWWAGDVIGVLIITPLLLWIYHRKLLLKNPQAHAFLIFCAGVGIVLLTTSVIGHNDRETSRKNVAHNTENLYLNMQTNIDLAVRDLTTLQEYFSNNTLNQNEFRKLTEPLLKQNTWLDSFSFLPAITTAETAATSNIEFAYTDSMTLARTTDNNFFWQKTGNGTFSDLLLNTIKLHKTAAHSDIFLRENNPIINIASPIYACNKKTNCNLSSIVSSELNLNVLMRATINKLQTQDIDIQLVTQNHLNEITYWSWKDNQWQLEPNQRKIANQYHTLLKGKTPTLKLMTNEWQLLITPQNISTWFLPNTQQCIIFIIGLAMVILLSAYLQVLYRQDQLIIENQTRLEEEIRSQTQALRAANDWLLKEIGEKHATQEQLKASEAHTRTLLDNIPDPIWFKSPEGVYLSINKAVSVLFHQQENDLVGKTADIYIDDELEKSIRDLENIALSSQHSVRRELWMYIPEKNQKRLMDTIKVAVRNEHNEPTGILSIARDITEQKQVEASLQLAKEAAEEANLAKSRFLANMSHEIRTPLNAVLGYSQLLMTDHQLSTQQHERMSSILNAGQRLLHLINDILDLSKIEAGALHFREDYFDLQQELNDILTLMHTKATTKGLNLKYDIQLPTPAIIKSDRQKIGQVILNLLGNSIKFTDSGEVTLNVYLENSDIVFNIIDTGPGIAEHELQQLFSAFKQGKSGEELGGTGLGLVISKHIAESLGGELNLDSTLGKGTCAHLRLPLSIEYDASLDSSPQITHAKLIKGSHCKVLVVEDDFASRDLLVNLLRYMGCDVIFATDGAEGLAQANNQVFDIIFTDIRMPNLNGTDMLKALRKTIHKDNLPVIAVSASSLEHERTFYLSEGFHEFIGKPYQFRDIYAALQKFTKAQFDISNNVTEDGCLPADEKINWNDKPALLALKEQLYSLKTCFSHGDMNNSKKLFTLQSAQTLGREIYQKIHNAIRQYDLGLAEIFVDELLTQINSALDSDNA